MQIFQQEYDDGISEAIKANASISYASAIESCDETIKSRSFKTLASVNDSDLYYTQSILVSSSWNKNDDIFDKAEVWMAKNSPEHKPTNLEHDESRIVGHIVANWPVTEDGILIDPNTPVENLPDKYDILTASVIYKGYTTPELRERTQSLINEIEAGTKFVSMECFFTGFDYGLIDKNSGEYKILARDNNTAYLTKYLRAYGGMGEHENYKIGRVLRNITFSGKGFVDKPANPDSIIFSKDSFKFLDENPKNNDFIESGVNTSQSNIQSENTIMNETTEIAAEETKPVESAVDTVVADLNSQLEASKAEFEAALAKVESEKAELAAAKDALEVVIAELKTELQAAQDAVAGYMKKEKKMMRKAALADSGFDSENIDEVVEKFDSVNDETFAAMTEMLKMKKKKEKMMMEKEAKADEAEATIDIAEALENVEETAEVNLAVGGDEAPQAESTRAALVDFVRTRLSKKLTKGE